MITDYQSLGHISKHQKPGLSNSLLHMEGNTILRKSKNSATAQSITCVWQDNAERPCLNNHPDGAKTRTLQITSVIINNLMNASNLV